ncbi:carbohydrate ABC transporter permease [Ochrobactrum sp. C6C9]|uniref:carbohydrate ABC transporter permease n=1 Tax=Ochrobactrum sp. C6C9 TaxID=2736662 RepID=UPI00352FF8AD|nr:carbohydrate ABC transporter permease [Ochrobactrum sp. C6C9]
MTATIKQLSLTAIGIILAIILLFPIYWMLMTAVMPTSEILSRNPALVPNWSKVTFTAFTEAFERRPLLQWIANSFFVSGLSTVFSLTVATLAGYSLSRWRMRLQQATGAMLLLSKLIPSSLIIIPLFIMFNTMGLNDSFFGLILANMAIGVPLATWLMKGFFDRIPPELEQAAMIDGCSRLSALWYVILPLTRPGLAAAGVYLLIVSWSEFIFARTLLTSDDKQVLTVGLQSFVGEYQVEWSNLMAAGAISLVPVVLLFLILEPFLVSGLTKGAMSN